MTTGDLPALDLSYPDTTFTGKDVPWLLRTRAELHGDRELLVWAPPGVPERRWTYAQFWSDVQRVANGLAQQGISKGDRLIILSENCPEMVISWFACSVIGAVAVTPNSRSVGAELTYLVEHTGATGALAQARLLPALQAAAPDLWCGVLHAPSAPGARTAYADLVAHEEISQLQPAEPMLPVSIMFTSGTTARPKAVVHTHANVLWGARSVADNMGLRRDDTYLVFLPFFHVHAQGWNLWPIMWVGGRIVLQPKFSASGFWPAIQEHGCTVASVLPFTAKSVVAQGVPTGHSLRLVFSPAQSRALSDMLGGVEVFSGWGMTETIVMGIRSERGQPQADLSIGIPAPGYEIAVIDPATGGAAVTDAIGELYVRGTPGVQMFLEYFRGEQAQREIVYRGRVVSHRRPGVARRGGDTAFPGPQQGRAQGRR